MKGIQSFFTRPVHPHAKLARAIQEYHRRKALHRKFLNQRTRLVEVDQNKLDDFAILPADFLEFGLNPVTGSAPGGREEQQPGSVIPQGAGVSLLHEAWRLGRNG
jgi:hypothetical protein